MAQNSANDSTNQRYDNKNPTHGRDSENTARRTRRRTQRPPPITEIHIADIDTVTMSADQETEAVNALAVLLARYWREHPDLAD
jgi:hypothetical protein